MGTAVIRTVVLGWQKGSSVPQVLATGESPSRGMRHGYITNPSEAVKALRKSVSLAEKALGTKISEAVFSIGGTSIESHNTQGAAVITKSDGEVTAFDMKKALADAESTLDTKNRRIIYASQIGWKLDGKEVQGKPEGMHGVKLEVRALHVSAQTQHLEDLISVAAEAGIEVLDVVPAPIAASMVALTERQKAVGVLLANIGAETVSVAVFEASLPIGLSVFPYGSSHITNDIALGFRIPLEEAEEVKLGTNTDQSKRKVDEIIAARYSDIFELIDSYLKKLKRSGLLPAGVLLIGGGSTHPLSESTAKDILRLPAKTGTAEILGKTRGPIKDGAWFVAYGLALIGRDLRYEKPQGKGGLKNAFKEFLRQFLP